MLRFENPELELAYATYLTSKQAQVDVLVAVSFAFRTLNWSSPPLFPKKMQAMELFPTGGGSRLQQHSIISSWRCWWCATLPSQPVVQESNTAVVLEEVRPANSHD
jgi:hypothetical protein